MIKKPITLKEALAKNKLEQFIKERDDEIYNPAAFNSAITKLVGKSKAVPATSSQDSSANFTRHTPRCFIRNSKLPFQFFSGDTMTAIGKQEAERKKKAA